MSVINGLYLFQCKYGAGVWRTQGWWRILIHSLQWGKHIWTVVMGIWWTRCDIVIICWGYHLCRDMFKQLLSRIFFKKENYSLYLLCYILCGYFFCSGFTMEIVLFAWSSVRLKCEYNGIVSFHLSDNLK